MYSRWNLSEALIDGQFIKIERTPILDFLKFEVSCYPFYKEVSRYSICKEITHLGKLETESKVKYKRLDNLGLVYFGKPNYTYTHYGKNLEHMSPSFIFHFIKSSYLMLSNFPSYTFRFKRIDFAYDFYGIDLIEMIKQSNVYSKKQLKVTYLSYIPDAIGSSPKRLQAGDPLYISNIQTIYIGNLKSKISFCIYKRHLKLGVTGPISRLEIRFKGSSATALAKKINNLNDPKQVNRLLVYYINKYISFKIKGSSKSNKLYRHKNERWWDEFLSFLQSEGN